MNLQVVSRSDGHVHVALFAQQCEHERHLGGLGVEFRAQGGPLGFEAV